MILLELFRMRHKHFKMLFVLGHSLTDFTQPLVSLGIKKGSKVMLIGKKVSAWI